MIIKTESDVTPAVVAAMGQTSDPRAREILMALVKHLHAFVREVRLTEVEFREATARLRHSFREAKKSSASASGRGRALRV